VGIDLGAEVFDRAFCVRELRVPIDVPRGENLLPANPRWLSEGYLKSKFHIIVHLGDGKGTQFAAVYQGAVGSEKGNHHRGIRTTIGILQNMCPLSSFAFCDAVADGVAPNGYKEPMLVLDVDYTEPIQGGVSDPGGIQTIVGLEGVDGIFFIFPSLYSLSVSKMGKYTFLFLAFV
jgi:hypothetical protein